MAIKMQLQRVERRANNSFRKMRFRVFSTKNEKRLFRASHSIITPFSGFIISDYYLSEEIDFHNLGWLNTQSRRITLRRVRARTSPAILYCQVDQIESFISNFLPHIRFPFTLITGKWHLPSLKPNTIFLNILANKWLVEWYSQNQVDEKSPIKPFPYGVNFENVITLAEIDFDDRKREINPLVPYSTVHPHMNLEDKKFRENLRIRMRPKKSFSEYLNDLKSHKYVVCTPGDRPDTYRHWESIACGAIPITLDGQNFQALFQNSAIYSNDFSDISPENLILNGVEYMREIATVKYWENKIQEELLNQKSNVRNSEDKYH